MVAYLYESFGTTLQLETHALNNEQKLNTYKCSCKVNDAANVLTIYVHDIRA